MTTIRGSYNVLVGAGAALPDENKDDQVVVGSTASTAYLAWDAVAGKGVIMAGTGATSGAALTIGAGTALSLAGDTGAPGTVLHSRGAGNTPSWAAMAGGSSDRFSGSYAPSTLSVIYTATGGSACTLTLPAAAGGSKTLIKNMTPALCTVRGSSDYLIYPLAANITVTSIQIASGGGAGLSTDGTYWFQSS